MDSGLLSPIYPSAPGVAPGAKQRTGSSLIGQWGAPSAIAPGAPGAVPGAGAAPGAPCVMDW